MAKLPTNGTLKFVVGLITLIGMALTLLGIVWNASTINSELVANCKADSEAHPQIPKNQIAIAEIKKDISVQERDLTRIEHKLDAQAAAQDAMLNMQQEILRELKRTP